MFNRKIKISKNILTPIKGPKQCHKPGNNTKAYGREYGAEAKKMINELPVGAHEKNKEPLVKYKVQCYLNTRKIIAVWTVHHYCNNHTAVCMCTRRRELCAKQEPERIAKGEQIAITLTLTKITTYTFPRGLEVSFTGFKK